MTKSVTTKPIMVVLALLTGVSAYAATTWEHFSSADGTAFEERWVATTAIVSLSSNETLASDMDLGASLDEDGGLFFWVNHVYSELCKFSDWELAVDNTVIPIRFQLSEDTRQTGLFPVDSTESQNLLKLFRDGEKIAIRFHANCDNMFHLNYIGTATMTYSLDGSSAALQFLATGTPEIIDGEERHSASRNSDEMTAYMFALQQKVLRNWARPSSAQGGLDCLVQVRQSATGEVISVRVVSCNGDSAVERSIEAAIYKASPLPLPDNGLLFDPNIRFRFMPEQ